ncbi:MAG: hypothetical protein Q9181_005548 [Wetmoreana brouardii]
MDFLKIDGRVEVERNVVPENLAWEKSEPSDQAAYPITVTLRHIGKPVSRRSTNGITMDRADLHSGRSADDRIALTGKVEAEGNVEKIRAKYLIGCDGAHSWTRNQIGLSPEGEQTDIRQSYAIHSASSGSIMTAPRERGLVRFYIQMNDMSKSGVLDRSRITPDSMLRAAQAIMKPYTLRFNIFLAGDAVHTHSPKLGQGLNVSMQDTYNLGWELRAVINGTAKPEILETYHPERHKIALELMAVDHETSCQILDVIESEPKVGTHSWACNCRYLRFDTSQFYYDDRISKRDHQSHRAKIYDFLSGVFVTCGPSALVEDTSLRSQSCPNRTSGGTSSNISQPVVPLSPNSLARHIRPGARLPSVKVLNQSDARPTHIASLLPSTGKWRILLFAGDLSNPAQFTRVQSLGSRLAVPSSFLHLYPTGSIEVITIHSAPRAKVELLDLHEVFHPWNEEHEWDYGKVYADEPSWHEGFADAYGA